MKLLVSVRSPCEAQTALEGGADLIDIKEPDRGSLGRADDTTIQSIINTVARRTPISAAYGELCEVPQAPALPVALDFVKFGLSGVDRFPWREQLLRWRSQLSPCVVPSAYADWERAGAPPLGQVAAFAVEHNFPVLLIDTFIKDTRRLFSWVERARLADLVAALRERGCRVALAGSLSIRNVGAMRAIQPDWVAVRGAVCAEGDRTKAVDARLVRAFKAALTSDIPGPG